MFENGQPQFKEFPSLKRGAQNCPGSATCFRNLMNLAYKRLKAKRSFWRKVTITRTSPNVSQMNFITCLQVGPSWKCT